MEKKFVQGMVTHQNHSLDYNIKVGRLKIKEFFIEKQVSSRIVPVNFLQIRNIKINIIWIFL